MIQQNALTRQGDVYHYGDLTLSPDPPEWILASLYAEWKKSGVLDWAFYGEPTSLLFFLQWFSRKDASQLGAYRKIDGQYVPLGLVWINQTFTLPGKFGRAEVAMAFNRGISPSVLLQVGRMATEWGFVERKLDALIGTTPVENKAAVAFGRRIGYAIAGPVHGMATWHGNMTSVMIQSMTKDQWAEISPFR